MITYCLHQMLILQHASLFQICNAVTISSEIKSLPFHTVVPNLHEKRRPSDKMKRPRQPAARQYTGPLALLNFVVNETASLFSIFFSPCFNLEKELNKWRQTRGLLENQGFFRLSLLYRNGIPTPVCWSIWDLTCWKYRNAWGTNQWRPHWTPIHTYTRTRIKSWPGHWTSCGARM